MGTEKVQTTIKFIRYSQWMAGVLETCMLAFDFWSVLRERGGTKRKRRK